MTVAPRRIVWSGCCEKEGNRLDEEDRREELSLSVLVFLWKEGKSAKGDEGRVAKVDSEYIRDLFTCYVTSLCYFVDFGG